MLFNNQIVDLAALPKLEEVVLERLAPAYLQVKYIGTLIFFLILWAIFIWILWFAEFEIPEYVEWGIGGVLLVWMFFSFWMSWRNFGIQGFGLREHDLTYRSGVFFRTTTVIPFNRVQHCEVNEGPIERWFGLKTLEVFTAGGDSSDLSIPGLADDRAEILKKFIIDKTKNANRV